MSYVDVRRLRRAYGVNYHLQVCFGRDDNEKRAQCECPRTCQRLCKTIRFTEERCPRVHDSRLGRPFTPLPNQLLESWGTNEVPAEVKLTYLFLVTRTRPNTRWVRTPLRLLAKQRGTSVKTLREHLKRLQDRDLILLLRMSEVSSVTPGPAYTVMILDLPAWLSTDSEVDEVDKVPDDDELLARALAGPDDEDDDDGDPDEELRMATRALRGED